tara:strand:- start:4106 stop:4822 length:717 start_codon:yes stop_codon:yes gene_type:complete
MDNLLLIGKNYIDTIVFVDTLRHGETNSCLKLIEKNGGVSNFDEVNIKNWLSHTKFFGRKKAFIVNENVQSERTSYVMNVQDSIIKNEDLEKMNQQYEWVHVSYVDDLEDYSKLSDLKIQYSLDFCTSNPREEFLDVMKKAAVLFDSRERKYLYENINLSVPLVLHDPNGVEIIINNKCKHQFFNQPLKNLNVNGAGDVFAAVFLDNYHSFGVHESAKIAMIETTNLLKNRIKNEQKI